VTFKFPKKLPKKWIEEIERNGRVGSLVHGLKVVGKDKRGTIVHLGKDSFKILHNGKNQNVFGNPLVGGLDPNFGYETIGADVILCDSTHEYIRGSVFTITEAGTADSITVALRRAAAGSDKVKCAIYLHSDLSLVGATEERTLDLTTTAIWYTFNFAAPKPSLTGNTEYVLVAWADYTAQTIYMARVAGNTDQSHRQDLAYNNFPNSLVPTHYAYKDSIYCTYTTGGAILKEVADSLSLSDAVSVNKNIIVTDSLSMADSVLRNKPLVEILDSLSLSDVVLVNKTMTVQDVLSIADAVSVETGVTLKEVLDTLTLQDLIKVNKSLQVSDSLTLQDFIQKVGEILLNKTKLDKAKLDKAKRDK
jgi:hypothetical protein